MKRRTTLAVLTVLSLAFGIAPANSSPSSLRAAAGPVRLEEATMIVEVNATDGDAGLQVFLDGEPWSSMTISTPDGRRILAINTRTRLRNYGLTELFSESSEPEGCIYSDRSPHQRFSPSSSLGRGAHGFGVARQCSRNRCLARWTVWIPVRTPEAEQVERTRRKTWSRAGSEFLYPLGDSAVRGSRRRSRRGRRATGYLRRSTSALTRQSK